MRELFRKRVLLFGPPFAKIKKKELSLINLIKGDQRMPLAFEKALALIHKIFKKYFR